MVGLLELRRPFVVGVVVERTLAHAQQSAVAAIRDGADAVELNLAGFINFELLDRKFFSRLRRPVYTSCRRAKFMGIYGPQFSDSPSLDEDQRMSCQLAAIEGGSAGLDIEADTFSPCRDEWTSSRDAVARQRQVARIAHRSKCAVIFSWHPPRKLTFAAARRGALELRERGADFVKIVERVGKVDEALDSVRISLRLRETLEFPFVFLPLGTGAEKVRPFMTAFGAAYLLARPALGSNRLPAQPLVARARALVDLS
ncbi:MAG: 3-dehydroquinate dehydratase [Verrucomicrobia bacterium]|nr:3-dehydroquinate dehydratase [Verrucomicrobiota bacterium]